MNQPIRLCLLLLIMTLAAADELFLYRGKQPDCPTTKKCESRGGRCQKKTLCSKKKIQYDCNKKKKCVCCIHNCAWDVEDTFPENPPLILDSKQNIVLPNKIGYKNILSVGIDKPLIMACSGEKNEFLQFNENGINTKCKSHLDMLEYGSKTYTMQHLGCNREVKSFVQAGNDMNWKTVCENIKGTLHEIGFKYKISNIENFKSIIKVCFDKKFETTFWTHHIIHGKHLDAHSDRSKIGRSFTQDTGFFTETMNSIYKPANQQKVMEVAINDEDIIVSQRRYLAKGHLSPVADFVTKAEMKATNNYINAIPQWNKVNGGNWEQIEANVQRLADKKNTDVTIISGGFRTLQLETKYIFLGKNYHVPVPETLWKIVVLGTQAVVFVVDNNPFRHDVPTQLCIDRCEELSWLNNFDKYKRQELCHGYTYCCEVDADLYKTISVIPNTGVFDLLK